VADALRIYEQNLVKKIYLKRNKLPTQTKGCMPQAVRAASCKLQLQVQFASAATPQQLLRLQLEQQTFQCGNVLDMHA